MMIFNFHSFDHFSKVYWNWPVWNWPVLWSHQCPPKYIIKCHPFHNFQFSLRFSQLKINLLFFFFFFHLFLFLLSFLFFIQDRYCIRHSANFYNQLVP